MPIDILSLIAGMEDGEQISRLIDNQFDSGYIDKSDVYEILVRTLERDWSSDLTKRLRLIKTQFKKDHIDEADLYEILILSFERNPGYYFERITGDDLTTYLWTRLSGRPELLAQALIHACPNLFYGDPAWVTRMIWKLKQDSRLGAELGLITTRASNGSAKPGVTTAVDKTLLDAIPRKIEVLDVAARVRELLYWYSRDLELAQMAYDEALGAASNDYEERVLAQALAQINAFLAMSFPGCIETIGDEGRLFPAPHVRWWLSQSEEAQKVLNIGDTGTYKTSFGFLSMRQAECSRVLILCTPAARTNWKRELGLYDLSLRQSGEVLVLESKDDLLFLALEPDFVIAGHNILANPDAVRALARAGFDGVIWDEPQYHKNVLGANAAQCALGCFDLFEQIMPDLKKLVALAATPWDNTPKEMALLAWVLRPELFESPRHFIKSGAYASPRFLRALFETCIVDIELREVRDLPKMEPDPHDDLFAAVPVIMDDAQMDLYHHLLHTLPESGDLDPNLKTTNGVDGSAKMRQLFYACDVPHVMGVAQGYDWPSSIDFSRFQLSAKLVALKAHLDEHLDTCKAAVATGLYVQGVCQPFKGHDDVLWIGQLLKRWYGDDAVLVLDGSVTLGTQRDALIHRWRTDTSVRILVVSEQACPDSVNLSLTVADETVQSLHLLRVALGWIPPKQPIGRYLREGQCVPIMHKTFVIGDTIDEARLRLNEKKWALQVAFRCKTLPTHEEMRQATQGRDASLKDNLPTPKQWVSRINTYARGLGEEATTSYLGQLNGVSPNGSLFARSFASIQDTEASGHIARHMRSALCDGLIPGGILDDPLQILDAGCGPATLARYLELPVVGVDLNPHMIRVAQELAPELAINSQVGRLSALADTWNQRFRLTVASMVLDWTSHTNSEASERLRILKRLFKVTQEDGLLWLTFSYKAMNDEVYARWATLLDRAGCKLSALSGLVVPVSESGKRTPDFAFWSLLVRVPGGELRCDDPSLLGLLFEQERTTYRRARKTRKAPKKRNTSPELRYDSFVVVDPCATGRQQRTDRDAIGRTVLAEIQSQFARTREPVQVDARLGEVINDWRTLDSLQARGVITFGIG